MSFRQAGAAPLPPSLPSPRPFDLTLPVAGSCRFAQKAKQLCPGLLRCRRLWDLLAYCLTWVLIVLVPISIAFWEQARLAFCACSLPAIQRDLMACLAI